MKDWDQNRRTSTKNMLGSQVRRTTCRALRDICDLLLLPSGEPARDDSISKRTVATGWKHLDAFPEDVLSVDQTSEMPLERGGGVRLRVPPMRRESSRGRELVFDCTADLSKPDELLELWIPDPHWIPPPARRVASRFGAGAYPQSWRLEIDIRRPRRPYLLRLDLARVQPASTGPVDRKLRTVRLKDPFSPTEVAVPPPVPPLRRPMETDLTPDWPGQRWFPCPAVFQSPGCPQFTGVEQALETVEPGRIRLASCEAMLDGDPPGNFGRELDGTDVSGGERDG